MTRVKQFGRDGRGLITRQPGEAGMECAGAGHVPARCDTTRSAADRPDESRMSPVPRPGHAPPAAPAASDATGAKALLLLSILIPS